MYTYKVRRKVDMYCSLFYGLFCMLYFIVFLKIICDILECTEQCKIEC
jgi:hypothetical protein